MSAIQVAGSTALANPADRLAAMAARMQNNIRTAAPTLQYTRGGLIKTPDGREVEELECVIIDFVYRNQWYEKPFAKGQFNAVSCQAVGEQENEFLTPQSNVPNKQAESCGPCPKNQWGSSPTGGNGKACSNQILLAIMMPDLSGDDDPLWTAKCQPTALANVRSHIGKMIDLYGHPAKVITTLKCDPARDYPSVLVSFKSMNPLWERHANFLDEAHRSLLAGAPPQGSGDEAPVQAVANVPEVLD